MTDLSVSSPAATLKRKGKTFWFGSLFLPKQMAAEAAVLYAFCRRMDDVADQQGGSEAADRLERVREELQAGRSEDPIVSGLIKLAERRSVDLDAADCLLDVLRQDAADDVRIQDVSDLLRYCYGAAGTVGLMMSAILGVSRSAARVQAVDLGIAMQLTNIARDVQEDARMGRRYLPASWVGGLGPKQIGAAKPGSQAAKQIQQAIDQILSLADIFYANAAPGFTDIPPAARSGIRIAAAVYRHIGVVLRGRQCDFTSGRVVVSLPLKLRIAAHIFAGPSELERLPRDGNAQELHGLLAGLPGFA